MPNNIRRAFKDCTRIDCPVCDAEAGDDCEDGDTPCFERLHAFLGTLYQRDPELYRLAFGKDWRVRS